ncbi:MAG: hypothetical protein AMJ53_16225 [Gammaproteobacteria bacterium SG8_11]|nr:MAG: hypothetical protein AMJ53_16225 [Gammaproteobacteria bacterium SG8_11]
MEILSKLQSLMGKKSSRDDDVLAEKLENARATKEKSGSRFFALQALEVLKKLELDGGTFICASPDFECYFKKKYMPLFDEKNAYIKVAFDKADNVTHVCGLLPRLQHEKDRGKSEDENRTLSKMPNCLLSRAIAELSVASKNNLSKAGHGVYGGQTASTQQQNSNFVLAPHVSVHSLKGVEQEWLDSMHTSLVDSEYQILLHLLQHSIIARNFKETIEHFLMTRKELEPGRYSVVINSFKYLAREFQFSEQTISVAQIGSSLEQMFNLKPREIFSVIVELFFCLGYEKEIKGYTTGFIESI